MKINPNKLFTYCNKYARKQENMGIAVGYSIQGFGYSVEKYTGNCQIEAYQ